MNFRVGERVQQLFSLVLVGALVKMVLDPLGYAVTLEFFGRMDSLHNLTLVLLVFLFLFGWRVFRRVSLKKRVLLAGAFCVAAYGLYDLLWFLEWILLTPWDLGRQLLSFVVCGLSVFLVPLLVLVKVGVPRLQLKILPVVVGLNLAAIFWLELSGFFPAWFLYWNGLLDSDPHTWVWFFGKIVGLLSWILVYLDYSGGVFE